MKSIKISTLLASFEEKVGRNSHRSLVARKFASQFDPRIQRIDHALAAFYSSLHLDDRRAFEHFLKCIKEVSIGTEKYENDEYPQHRFSDLIATYVSETDRKRINTLQAFDHLLTLLSVEDCRGAENLLKESSLFGRYRHGLKNVHDFLIWVLQKDRAALDRRIVQAFYRRVTEILNSEHLLQDDALYIVNPERFFSGTPLENFLMSLYCVEGLTFPSLVKLRYREIEANEIIKTQISKDFFSAYERAAGFRSHDLVFPGYSRTKIEACFGRFVSKYPLKGLTLKMVRQSFAVSFNTHGQRDKQQV